MSQKQETIEKLKKKQEKHQASIGLIEETIRHVELFYNDDMEPRHPYDANIPVIHGTPIGPSTTIN